MSSVLDRSLVGEKEFNQALKNPDDSASFTIIVKYIEFKLHDVYNDKREIEEQRMLNEVYQKVRGSNSKLEIVLKEYFIERGKAKRLNPNYKDVWEFSSYK